MNYFSALLICAVAVALEAVSAGRDPMGRLGQLDQPSWSPPIWAWVLIGLAWYAIGFTALVRLLAHWPVSALPVILLVALLAANGAINLLQFRMNRLDLAFYSLFPYWVLLAAFILAAWPVDRFAAVLFGAYAFYQIYAGAWCYQLWKMNPRRHSP